MNEIDKNWWEFWAPILIDKGTGKLNMEQLKKELFDYWTLMDAVPKVYMEITNGRISKPNTDPAAVLSEYYGHLEEIIEEDRANG